MARHGPFIAADRRMVDTVQGGRGEAGAAQACPWCRRRAVGACGVINWSGGPGELRRTSALSRGRGARVRSEATVASWERRPVVLGRVQGRQREQGRARERRGG